MFYGYGILNNHVPTLRATVMGGSNGIDVDATAFITAASITDTTQKSAINTLVTDLKGYGIWTKMKAVYPFVGGTASQHKFNLKDPRDLDAAFRLVFYGGGTHSSTGYLGNGTNAWANTNLFARTILTNSNIHLSFYSRTANATSAFSAEIIPNGSYNASEWTALRTNNKTGGGIAYFSAGDDSKTAGISSTTNGFYLGSETSSILRKLYKNGTAIASNTASDLNNLPTLSLSLLGSPTNAFSGNETAFASMGDGLTDTEATNFYTAVQKFNTTLSRNI